MTWPRSIWFRSTPRRRAPTLSPAIARSSVLLNISMPVRTVFRGSLVSPMISTSSPTLADPRDADLAGEEDVLAGLRHRPVVGGDHEDGAVHLGGAGDHVLDVVGVARAVDVGVVPVGRLVLDVRDGDRHGLVLVADGATLR